MMQYFAMEHMHATKECSPDASLELTVELLEGLAVLLLGDLLLLRVRHIERSSQKAGAEKKEYSSSKVDRSRKTVQ
jgi:hypothetical protein